ncbi:hypothetical protein KY289_000682 [Solanum tuberosum]|nr:hypothetical protein KY289_000682 [Solanum tuberosum]
MCYRIDDVSGTHQGSNHYLQCSIGFSKNIAEMFPTISLNFAGDASMNLTPTDYLEDMSFFMLRLKIGSLYMIWIDKELDGQITILFHLQLSQSHQQCTHAISLPQDLSSFSKNIVEVFPTISLNFAGAISRIWDGAAKWCIRFIRKDPSLTILGELPLEA